MKSIVLLSGGMDSTLTAAIALRESESVAALHLNYRHRTEQREMRAFTEVADALGISFETVRSHLKNIYDKLHVHSRTEAVVKYLRN